VTETGTALTNQNLLRYERTEYRVFNFNTAYNLTEYGHFTSSSGANAVFRDLLRQDPNDPNSQAITISVQDGDQLQIIRTLTIEVAWEEVADTQTLTVPGGSDITLNGTSTIGVSVQSSNVRDAFYYFLWPGVTNLRAHLLKTGTSSARDVSVNGSYAAYVDHNRDTYVAGTHERTGSATFGTSQGNQELGGWAITYSNRYSKYVYKFVFGSGFTKDSTHTLTINHKTTWSRG